MAGLEKKHEKRAGIARSLPFAHLLESFQSIQSSLEQPPLALLTHHSGHDVYPNVTNPIPPDLNLHHRMQRIQMYRAPSCRYAHS